MTVGLKVAATVGVVAGATVSLIEVAVGAGLTGHPIVDGLLGGAGVSLLTIGVYKNKVDSLKEDVKEIKEDLRELRRHLMGESR